MPQVLTMPKSLAKLPCWFGLDLSNVNDTTSLAAVWRDDKNRRVYAKNFFWLPEESAKSYAAKGKSHWLTWGREGHVTLVPGSVVDHDVVKDAIVALAGMVTLREVAYDPWSAVQLVNKLAKHRPKINTVEVSQALRFMSPAMKELERQLGLGEFKHDGNPVMAWQIKNVRVISDSNGNTKPDKKKSEEKIDGPAALLTAMARAMVGGGGSEGLYGGTGIAII